jgi:hypothetical protein
LVQPDKLAGHESDCAAPDPDWKKERSLHCFTLGFLGGASNEKRHVLAFEAEGHATCRGLCGEGFGIGEPITAKFVADDNEANPNGRVSWP